MKEINVNTFDFPRVIRNNYLYVDKTALVWRLVKPAFSELFLSRPRRFGKSLLVSTLKAVFKGQRELFKGLAIDQMDYDWKAYPVIHLDFGNCDSSTPDELDNYLEYLLAKAAKSLGLSLRGEGLSIRFGNLIEDAAASSEHKEAVVLVDEYDKPILGNIDNPELCKKLLKNLKGFYSNIKTYEGVIRFAFITGVSKFAHVSLFSDMNNLTDITLSQDYAELLGFTEAEIRQYFVDGIPQAAQANGYSEDVLMERLLHWYDGYRFSKRDTHLCNPVSISRFFTNHYDFANYWDDTGTPAMLVKYLHERSYDIEAALSSLYDESIFRAYELDNIDITGLLWQTGYLTIKDVVRDGDETQYRLDFPDREVQVTFNQRIIASFAGVDRENEAKSLVRQFRSAIQKDDLDGFMSLFQSFLATISYDMHLPYEKYYQTIFFVVFKLIGASIEAESRTNQGRIDAFVRTQKTVYIFEFKLNKEPEDAIGQIIDRRYYEKFQKSGLPIVMVGVNFDSSKGRINGWAVTTLA